LTLDRRVLPGSSPDFGGTTLYLGPRDAAYLGRGNAAYLAARRGGEKLS
jgi:hypothetical protein